MSEVAVGVQGLRILPGFVLAFVCAVGGMWLGAPSSATAQTPSSAAGRDEAGRSEFDLGREAYDHGQFAVAILHFERAYVLSRRPELLYNIGRAADSDGQATRAVLAYTEYLERVPSADNRDFVQARIDKLRSVDGQAPRAPKPAPPPASVPSPSPASASSPSGARASPPPMTPAPSVVSPRAAQPMPARPVFNLANLSGPDRERYLVLSGKRRGLGGPIAGMAVSGAVAVVIVLAYAVLASDTCAGATYPCTDTTDAPPGLLASALVPAAGLVLGGVMLGRKIKLRREYDALTKKGMGMTPAVTPMIAPHAASLSLKFQF